MIEEVLWTWKPKQKLFIETGKRYAAFVGTMGCGKTAAFVRRAIAIAQKYPGSRGLLCRFTFSEVNDTLVPQFMEHCPPNYIKSWKSTSGALEIKAAGGGYSTILFKNLEDPRKYRSENLNFVGLSQADDDGVTEEHWTELTNRLRRMRGLWGPLPKQYAFLDANFHGHNWVWQIFHKDGQIASGRVNTDGSPRDDRRNPSTGELEFDPEKYLLIEGFTQENAENLPSEYLASMASAPEEWKKRHYYGSWDEMGGLVYEEFGQNHITSGVFVNNQWQEAIPYYWNRYRSIDHGLRSPTACLWATTSPSGTVYIYDEYYNPGDVVHKHAEKIRRKYADWDAEKLLWVPREQYKWTVIDPAAHNTEGTSGESPIEQYFAHGVAVTEAPVGERDVPQGINVVKRYLTEIDRVTGRPRLQIVGRKCPNLLREIKEYVWDELGPTRRSRRNEPERPRKLRDHTMDALRYLLVSRPQASPDISPKSGADAKERRREYQESWEID